ncbi:histone-lysine N-methyltransferase trithorax, partial [Clonorchis sinensis]
FTPPVPVPEGCARAICWSKPRLPSNHARDPLSFLSCAGNPPPRPLVKSDQSEPNRKDGLGLSNTILSPNERTTVLSPTEQAVCAEAARQAASLVASQLKLPLRMREACIAQAVVQATGFLLQPNTSDDPASSHGTKTRLKTTTEVQDEDYDQEQNDESSEDDKGQEDETDLGTVTTQFKRMVSGSMARYLRVAVHPSHIHGRGLFALRGFREDEMVIEYMGELIRNFVCETREIRYRSAGVDCYMFRIDSDLVIDATYAGNAARFINHSCDPNCYAKVVTVDDKKHIVILAQRRIYPGEELTYDYRFPKESDKLLCNCGSYNCRKYLN